MVTDLLYSTPWTPTYEGVVLAPYRDYDILKESKMCPDPDTSPEWARSTVLGLTKDAVEADAAIWESVLALWLLYRLGEPNMGVIWEEHTRAWLVSCPVATDLRGCRD